ncbi:MAG: hypothetical protein M3273_05980 [Actinomycetota bacterium]|nr:hypothetical protein [Actinomycetota bacterium]
MRRKIGLVVAAGAVAAMSVVPAAPASAAMICNTGDPLTDRIVCGTLGTVASVLCKVSGGKYCMT